MFTVLYIFIEKNLHISRPTQLKPLLLKGPSVACYKGKWKCQMQR